MYYFLSFNEDSEMDCYQFDVGNNSQEIIIFSGDIVFINYGNAKESNESVLKGEVSCMAGNYTAKTMTQKIFIWTAIFSSTHKKSRWKKPRRGKNLKRNLL